VSSLVEVASQCFGKKLLSKATKVSEYSSTDTLFCPRISFEYLKMLLKVLQRRVKILG
jgi:hypothetical protein